MDIDVNFQKIANLIDEEIHAYEQISELYEKKRLALISGTSDELLNIDGLILNQFTKTKNINQFREIQFGLIGSKVKNMSDLINLTNKESSFSVKFIEQKEQIEKLAIKITQQEKRNIELLNHGVKIIGKTIELIVSGTNKNTNNYDRHGKNADKLPEFSSITEEV